MVMQMAKGPKLEEALDEVRKHHQNLDAKFVDLFIDAIYEIVMKLIEKDEKESNKGQK